jgi:hypothetical protein
MRSPNRAINVFMCEGRRQIATGTSESLRKDLALAAELVTRNTFGPNGFSLGSNLHVSPSK